MKKNIDGMVYALLLLMAPALAGADEAERVNAVSFDKGAVLLSRSSEYGGRDATQWLALGLIDGTGSMGWASAEKAPFPHRFLFELARPHTLHALAFDTKEAQESGYPGISARDVIVSAATESREGPFSQIYAGAISAGGITEVDLPSPAAARWLKLEITTNGGDPKYTELMEFQAFGISETSENPPLKSSGTYHTNWNDFYMRVEANRLSGCYDWDQGVFSGAKSGDFMNLEWRETDPDQMGKAVMAITEDGSAFNGFWYEGGRLRGTWSGTRIDEGKPPACAEKLAEKAGSEIQASLDQTGRAVMYGIYFDHDSDLIKPESRDTLEQVLAWLKANPAKPVTFEGHTDSDGSDAYNEELSARRAAAVKEWMVSNGIKESRLTAKGWGESRPVAANTTTQGKSLNRRVEISVTK